MKLLQRRLFAEHVKTFLLASSVLLLFILLGRALQLVARVPNIMVKAYQVKN